MTNDPVCKNCKHLLPQPPRPGTGSWGDWRCRRCGEAWCQDCGGHIDANTGQCEAYEDTQPPREKE